MHAAIGYTDFLHVLPALLGLLAFLGSVLALGRVYRALYGSAKRWFICRMAEARSCG